MSALLSFVASFAAMEAVSYATHRWVMHGPGVAWHRSHHAPPTGRLERNDWFPVCFAAVGVALFLAASVWVPALWWVAAGVTAYGACYLAVHEVYIHRRVAAPLPRSAYLEWLRAAHADHHRAGGEPFGMLLPLVRDQRRRGSGDGDGRDRLDRSSAR